MSSDQVVTAEVTEAPAPPPQPKGGRGLSAKWFTIIGAVIVFNIVAFIFFPPFPKEGDARATPAPTPPASSRARSSSRPRTPSSGRTARLTRS